MCGQKLTASRGSICGMSTTELTPTPAANDAAPAPSATPRPAGTRGVWRGLVVVPPAAGMVLVDGTIAQPAAPAIRANLSDGDTDLECISAAYPVAMSVGLLVDGRLRDVFGRSRVVPAGMGGYVLGSVLCALAPSAG